MIIDQVELQGIEGKSRIVIRGNKIIKIEKPVDDSRILNESVIHFDNAIVFPGLINSHDHLEFNLFPQLGHKKYTDYIEWGDDIHEKDKDIINEILKVPLYLRTEYGSYKNLLNGITTVVHHGNFPLKNNFIIDVYKNFNYLHSVRLDKNWRFKLNIKTNRIPFNVHIGEGTNAESYSEVKELIRWNLFNKPIIGVHGITLGKEQAKKIKALVWCPISNEFLYGSTCRINELKTNTGILFGTDSNVSADWNLWDHLRFAKKTSMLTDPELFNSLTSAAANVWQMKDKGIITIGAIADIVVAEKNAVSFFDSFFSIEPQNILMIVKSGNVILFDAGLSDQFKDEINVSGFTKIKIGERNKFVIGRLDELCRRIKSYTSAVNFPFETEN